jgi:curved DNA-binding protein CbpA
MSATVPNGEFVDYYELLEVTSSAGPQQIRTNYIRLAKTHHPDTGGSTDYMQLLNSAYRTLTTSLSRSAYDRLYELHFGVSPEAHFKEDGEVSASNAAMSDDYADYFLDKTYAEYHMEPKSHQNFVQKLKKILPF